MTIMSCEFESHFLHEEKIFAEIAQLVEHNLAKVRVASSSLVFRSPFPFLGCSNGGMVDTKDLKSFGQ